MEDQIEIEEDALKEWLEDKDFRGRARFSESQIKLIIDNIDIITRPWTIKFIKSEYGFDMFQIRYLLKLFSI